MARILVADDEPSIRQVITLVCQDARHVVEAVGTTAEAIRAYDAFAPELMILDVSMPGGGAEKILAQLDARGAPLACPVILISGYPDFEFRGLPTLRKPFNIADLGAAVARALAG